MAAMKLPDPGGRFGEFGGQYLPESLVPACQELEEAFTTAWADEARYATNPARIENRDTLIPALSEETRKWLKTELLAAFERETVPAGPINTLPEVFADPQVIHRRMTFDLPEPAAKGGAVPTLRGPIVIDGEPMVGRTAAPRLGQHNEDVLADPNWS